MYCKGIAIDCPSSKGLDDSLWIDNVSKGWVITVAIANVSDHIKAGSTFDLDAMRRVETVYDGGSKVRTMLPRMITESQCSLIDHGRESVLACRIHIGNDLKVKFSEFEITKIEELHVVKYSDIPNIIKDPGSGLYSVLRSAATIANLFIHKRIDGEAYSKSEGWFYSESQKKINVAEEGEAIGHLIVQEFMILANIEFAKFCAKRKLPVPYRNHGPKIFDSAYYASKSTGHIGLGIENYVHATSPIRRYADLVTQRQIIRSLRGESSCYSFEEIENICNKCNSPPPKKIRKSRFVDEISIIPYEPDYKAKAFEIKIRDSVEGGYDKKIEDEFIERLAIGRFTISSAYYVLVCSGKGEPWSRARDSLMSHLVQHSGLAASIASTAHQSGKWSAPKFSTRRTGESGRVLHVASVHWDRPSVAGEEASGSSLRVAKQRALIKSYAQWLGTPIPTWDKINIKNNNSLRKINPNAIDSIGELAEFCSVRKADAPEYKIIHCEGKPSKYVAVCKAAGIWVKSPMLYSKISAKKESARRAIRLIHERT